MQTLGAHTHKLFKHILSDRQIFRFLNAYHIHKYIHGKNTYGE